MRMAFIISILFLLNQLVTAQQLTVNRIVMMPGNKEEFKEIEFDDRFWKSVNSNSPWENEGFSDYDGFAWYRVHFTIQSILPNQWYTVSIGRLDDVDITYLNGEEIGRTGSFPPNYYTAYHVYREYIVSGNQFKTGENVLAIRVYDERLLGGWLEGRLELLPLEEPAQIVMPILGYWKFKTGDEFSWSDEFTSDTLWDSIRTQQAWEKQGYEGYNGFAWYRKKVILPKFIQAGSYQLNLGQIDDADQVFINGELIGQTGTFTENQVFYDDLSYKKTRLYDIPDHLMESESEWTIAVRVYDGLEEGGMIAGHILIQKKKELTETMFEDSSWLWTFIKRLVEFLKKLF
jgi:sialate O-acetylesterase